MLPMISIVTPCCRVANIAPLFDNIHPHMDIVRKWVIMYDGKKVIHDQVPLLKNNEKIIEKIFEGPGISGNPQRNAALDLLATMDDQSGYIYFLDDDNIIQDNLWALFYVLAQPSTPLKIYTWDMVYPNTCLLYGNCPKELHIDTSMFIVPYHMACKHSRWTIDKYSADGVFIENLVKQFPSQWEYIPRRLAVHNALQETPKMTSKYPMKIAVIIGGRSACFVDVFLRTLSAAFDLNDVHVYMSLNEERCTANDLSSMSVVRGIAYGPVISDETVKRYASCIVFPETNIKNTYSMFLHNKRAFAMIPEDESYDAVVKYRPDIIPQRQLPLSIKVKGMTVLVPGGNDWRGGINDTVAFGNYESMRMYCSAFDFIDTYVLDERIPFHPETILARHLESSAVGVVRFEWPCELSKRRHDQPQANIDELQSTGDWERIIEFVRNGNDKALLARALFETGEIDRAIEVYEACLQQPIPDKDVKRTLYIQLLYAHVITGRPCDAELVCKKALSEFPDDAQFAYLLGVIYMDKGMFGLARHVFNAILEYMPTHTAWYKWCICTCLMAHVDDVDFEPDALFSHSFKVAEAENTAPTLWLKASNDQHCEHPGAAMAAVPVNVSSQSTPNELCVVADHIGKLFVLDTKGFPRNRRICRAMGFAVIDVVSRVRHGSTCLAWRDFMSILVRWRQIASRHDSVWWIQHDRPNDISALRTPLYVKTRSVFRYKQYIQRVLVMIKERVLGSPEFNDCHDRIRALSDEAIRPCDILEVFNGSITVLQSIGDEKIPGVTFALTRSDDGGVMMSVSGVQSDDRTQKYEHMLSTLFETTLHDVDALFRFAYYWFNFQRLTRGTAVCGLAAIVAIVYLTKRAFPKQLSPRDVQWDWESFVDTSEHAVGRHMREYVIGSIDNKEIEIPNITSPLSIAEMVRLLNN